MTSCSTRVRCSGSSSTPASAFTRASVWNVATSGQIELVLQPVRDRAREPVVAVQHVDRLELEHPARRCRRRTARRARAARASVPAPADPPRRAATRKPGSTSTTAGCVGDSARVYTSHSTPARASAEASARTYTFMPPPSPAPGCASGEVCIENTATRRTDIRADRYPSAGQRSAPTVPTLDAHPRQHGTCPDCWARSGLGQPASASRPRCSAWNDR